MGLVAYLRCSCRRHKHILDLGSQSAVLRNRDPVGVIIGLVIGWLVTSGYSRLDDSLVESPL